MAPKLTPGVALTDPEIFYPAENELRPTLERHQEPLSTVLGWDTAQRVAFNRYAVALKRETRLPTQTVTLILDALVSDAVAATRETEVDVDQRAQGWKEESRRRLRDEFATKGWDPEDLAKRVEAFVARQPRLREALASNGLGSRPDIYLSLVEHVRTNDIR